MPFFVTHAFFRSFCFLTSGCVSCVGWPTSSSNKGKEANEREETCFVPREEEEEEEEEEGEVDDVAADTERAVAATIDDGESFADEAAAAVQRLARSMGRESLPAGAMTGDESRERNTRGLPSLFLSFSHADGRLICFALAPFSPSPPPSRVVGNQVEGGKKKATQKKINNIQRREERIRIR